jgi:hypothetical protein
MPPPAVTNGYSKFPEGTPVRDLLSGREGVVAKPPEGDFGEVVFVTFDNVTSAVRSDQLENTSPAATPLEAPPMGGVPGEELPGAPAAAGEELPPPPPAPGEAPAGAGMPNLASAPPANLQAKPKFLKREKPYVAPEKKKEQDCMGSQDFLVTNVLDKRRIMYSTLKAMAQKSPSHEAVASYIGYIPRHWDGIVSRLKADGIVLQSTAAEFDVADFVAKEMTPAEIRFVLASSGVRLNDINAALVALGGKPMVEKPKTDPGAGNQWVWDAKNNAWEAWPIGASQQQTVSMIKAERKPKLSVVLKGFRRFQAGLTTLKGIAITAASPEEEKKRAARKTKKESTKIKFPNEKLTPSKDAKPEPTEEELAKEAHEMTWHQRSEDERRAKWAKKNDKSGGKPEFPDKKIDRAEFEQGKAEERKATAPRTALELKRKITDAKYGFTIYEGVDLDIADWKKATQQMGEHLKSQCDFHVDNGWDEDDAEGTFEKEMGFGFSDMEEKSGGNTYNEGYFAPDLNYRIYKGPEADDGEERWVLEVRLHEGGDVRGNYSGGYYFRGSDAQGLEERFYELYSGSLWGSLTFEDGSTLDFYGENSGDMPGFNVTDTREEPKGMAEQFRDAVAALDSYDRDNFLDSCLGR